jgi:hypothetical protein
MFGLGLDTRTGGSSLKDCHHWLAVTGDSRRLCTSAQEGKSLCFPYPYSHLVRERGLSASKAGPVYREGRVQMHRRLIP